MDFKTPEPFSCATHGLKNISCPGHVPVPARRRWPIRWPNNLIMHVRQRGLGLKSENHAGISHLFELGSFRILGERSSNWATQYPIFFNHERVLYHSRGTLRVAHQGTSSWLGGPSRHEQFCSMKHIFFITPQPIFKWRFLYCFKLQLIRVN